MFVDDTSLVQLHIRSLIERAIGECFTLEEDEHVFTREKLYYMLSSVVRESLEVYRENFALGMKQTLTEARLRSLLEEEKK